MLDAPCFDILKLETPGQCTHKYILFYVYKINYLVRFYCKLGI